jgi:hypothetical protein
LLARRAASNSRRRAIGLPPEALILFLQSFALLPQPLEFLPRPI